MGEACLQRSCESIDAHETGLFWFAVQVRATHEKRVASQLDNKGYEWLLPLYTARRRWSDRNKEVELPLFPGYIFCRFAMEARLPVLATPSVLRIVGSGSTPIPVDDEEMAAVKRAAQSGLSLSPYPLLRIGQRVRINGGSLDGLEGLIIDVRQRTRLVLSVSLLQRAVAVEIDSAWATPIIKSITTICSRPSQSSV